MIYIPFLYFVFMFLYFFTKKKCIETGGVIVLLYLIGSLLSIVYYKNSIKVQMEYNEFDQIIPTFFYLLLLSLSIVPFYKFNSCKIKLPDDLDHKKFMWISYFLIILIIVSVITNLDAIVLSLNEEFVDTRNEAYQLYLNSKSTRMSQSIWSYFIAVAPSFAPLLLLFYFYATIKKIGAWYFRTILLLASTINVILGILTASRTPILYWLITFMILLFTFRHLLEKRTKMATLIVFAILLIPIGFYFMLVTTSRFGDEESSNSLLFYAGQTYPTFCKLYNIYTFEDFTFDRLFPISTKYILGHNFNMMAYREVEGLRLGMDTGVFFTFMGDAMIDFGKMGMIIYTLVYVALIRNALSRKSDKVSLSYLIIMLLLVRQVSLGYFAYVYKSITTSIFIIGSLAIAYFLRPSGSKGVNKL